METYKQEFIEFMVACNVLRFGDFITKSGRRTPFFINTGFYRTGSQLQKLGQYYARAIAENFGTVFDVLFGPAYKGIPLSVMTSIALAQEYGRDVRYCSNRKEIKDHGDTGILLGSPISDGDRVVIIEDVTTAGTSIRETVPILRSQAKVELAGLVVSVDRMERGSTEKSALLQIEEEFGMRTAAIVNMDEVTQYLYNRRIGGNVLIDEEIKAKIDEYYRQWGGKKA